MSNNDVYWIALLLKDKYAVDLQKQNLKIQFVKILHLKQDDICYMPFDKQSGMSYYFFIKQHNNYDVRKIIQVNNNAFQPYTKHLRIKDVQLKQIIRNIYNYNTGNIKFGDIVSINKGRFKKLNGIVLRQNRNGKLDIGLKFCFGTVVQSYDFNELSVIGNIFNYVKVLR